MHSKINTPPPRMGSLIWLFDIRFRLDYISNMVIYIRMILWVIFCSLLCLPQLSMAKSLNDEFNPAFVFNPNAPINYNTYPTHVIQQSDGKILVAGNFLSVNGKLRNGIARLNIDGSVDESFVPPAGLGSVTALASQPDGKVLYGTGTDYITGVTKSNLIRLNNDGSLDSTFEAVPDTSIILRIMVQPNGKILVGGNFVTINNIHRHSIARLNEDGSVDPSFNPEFLYQDPNDYTWPWNESFDFVVLPDGKIVITGMFLTSSDKSNMVGVIKINDDGTLASIFEGSKEDPRNRKYMTSIVMQPDGKFLVTANYSSKVDYKIYKRLRRFNSDGSNDASFSLDVGEDFCEYAKDKLIRQPDGKIVVGGYFSNIYTNGQKTKALTGLARINVDGTWDNSFNPILSAPPALSWGCNYSIPASFNGIVQQDGQLLLAPSSYENLDLTINNEAHTAIFKLYNNGLLDTNFSPILNGAVISSVIKPDGKVLAGGLFTVIDGQSKMHMAQFTPDGKLDSTFNTEADNLVRGLAQQPDGKVVAIGDFVTLGGQPRNHIARLNFDGTLDAAFNPNVDNIVRSLSQQSDKKVLIGGDFTKINNQSRNHIARLNLDGSLDLGFNPGTNGVVYTIAIQSDEKILMGGRFNIAADRLVNNIARINNDGVLDFDFKPNIDGVIFTMAIQSDGKIIIGGVFNNVNGQPRENIARLNIDGSLDTEFIAGANSAISSLNIFSNGKILIGGQFTVVNGVECNYTALLKNNGEIDTSFSANANASVAGLSTQFDGKILMSGDFTTVNEIEQNFISRLGSTEAALQNLEVANTGMSLRWWRSGASPEISQVRFSMAATEDAPEEQWVDLGAATRATNGWVLNDISLPFEKNIWIRAEGRAFGGWHNSSASILRSVRVAYLFRQPPAAPLNLRANPENEMISLNWTAPISDGGAAITGYTVRVVPDGGIVCTTPIPKCTISGLTNGITYKFFVTAENSMGAGSPSTMVLATPRTIPDAPVNLTAVVGDSAIILTWAAPTNNGGSSITRYVVTAQSTAGGALTECVVTITRCAIFGLTNGVTYNFWVTSINEAGSGNASAILQATPDLLRYSNLILPYGGLAAAIIGAPPGCVIAAPQFSTTIPKEAPKGAIFPLGLFGFTASGCFNATLSVRIDYPIGSLRGLTPYKYGPPANGATASWFPHGTIIGDSVTYIVIDNGIGDSDILPGSIADPFAPVMLPTDPESIPSLSEWGIFWLSLLIGVVSLKTIKRTTRDGVQNRCANP